VNKAKLCIFFFFLACSIVFIIKFISFPLSREKVYSSEHNIRNYKDPRANIVGRNGIALVVGNGTERKYRFGRITSHFIGFYDPRLGMSGIEGDYSQRLIDNNRASLYYFGGSGEDKAPLKVTIDIGLQKVCDEALGGLVGAIVVLDPTTGEILSLISHPNFDPNKKDWKELQKRGDAPLLNRATKGFYNPGSLWKTIVALNLLGKKEITYVSPVSYTVGDKKFKCNHPGTRINSLADAYAYSDNCYFLHRGLTEVSVNDFARTSNQFMSRELPATLKKIDYAFSIIGQGPVLVSPLQESLLAGTIINDGRMQGPVSVKGEKSEQRDIISKSSALSLQQMMVGVVKKGTGRKLSNFLKQGVVGLKTGTAEKDLKKGKKINITSMAGFAYFKGKKNPVSFAVVVEDSRLLAANQCSPIVAKILNYYFSHYKE